MKCTIHMTEPSILMDAGLGDLFVVREADEHECVFALLSLSASASLLGSRLDGEQIRVVAVACRVDPGEPGHHSTGESLQFKASTPIQFVEQVEVASFRERGAVSSPLKSLTVDQQAAAIVKAFDRAAIHRAYCECMQIPADELVSRDAVVSLRNAQ